MNAYEIILKKREGRELSVAELEWFADRRHLNPRAGQGPLDHYRRWWIRKRGDRFRLIEAPKPTMRELQRSLLRDVLAAEPPHEAAHGFVTGRSVLTHASLHSARRTLVVLDLEDFFSTISEARVRGVFRSMGYPREVAGSLAGLCTTVAPKDVLDQMQRMSIASSTTSQRSQRARLAAPHLPQGAPTSPALSNLCARRLDARLSGLAASRGATYSRYADDLAFSGDGGLSHGIDELIALIAAIAADEGFAVNFRKTRVMRSGRRQRLTGLVVNKHPNVQRSELDQLKAILTNCVRHGPESQNRAQRPDFRAFLEGKVSWVEAVNPHRGRRLRELLEAVRW